MLYACAAPIRNLSIRDGIDALLGVDHHTIADIQWPGGARQVIFEKGQRQASIAITGDASPERGAAGQFVFYLGLGVEHIIGGIDHLLFLLALLALATSLWQTVKIVTAFTVAHSITLSLAALGHGRRAVVDRRAADRRLDRLGRRREPRGAGGRWPALADRGCFRPDPRPGVRLGLVELDLPRDALLRALVGFNIGVELGQLAFVAVVMPPLVWASRPGRLPRLPQILSVIVALVGAVWLVERLLAV